MAQFASDAFTGTEGDLLSTYSANWTLHTSYTGTAEIASSRVRQTSTTTTAYYHSGTPATADYSVSADLFMKDTNGGDGAVGVIGRVDTAANTLYMARYNGGATDGWQLYKAVTGTFTQLGSTSAQSLTAATAYNVKLEMIGTAIKLYKELSGTATISATDSAITAAGKAGIRCATNGLAPSDTTGIHLDNFSADDVASGVTLIELTAAIFNWTENAIQNRLTTTMSAPTLTMTPQSTQNRSTITTSLASLQFTAQSIKNRAAVTLTAATLSFVGKALQNKLAIGLTVAGFSFFAWAIDVTGAIASAVARFLTLLGVGS